ncbi:MAG: hypothetical protein FWC22_06510 [Treponema sp.]|nr:hypothetical protein [Treponema sp.]
MALLIVSASIFIVSQVKNGVRNERRELLQVWNDGNYEQSYEMSKNSLLENPVDYFLLTINGFAAYQMGISQINNQNLIRFIDECIFSLRKALLQKESAKDGRVFYVLGKAYGYKGAEYADLAVKYLENANKLEYPASDIPEYLGLAYAAYGDYRSSVEAFSLAFIPDKPPSDNLLLSIARSYIAMEEYNVAQGYLQRCIDISPDTRSVVIARSLLAEIFKINGDYDNALVLYNAVLNDSGESAEVRFQLGELFLLRGDTTRARSEWRTAYRLDPAHARARARLNL